MLKNIKSLIIFKKIFKYLQNYRHRPTGFWYVPDRRIRSILFSVQTDGFHIHSSNSYYSIIFRTAIHLFFPKYLSLYKPWSQCRSQSHRLGMTIVKAIPIRSFEILFSGTSGYKIRSGSGHTASCLPGSLYRKRPTN